MKLNRHMIERLMQLGVLNPDGQQRGIKLPFNGTLSHDERRMLEQGTFEAPSEPVYTKPHDA